MELIIAPMAGVTDFAFRQILKKYKPDLMYTEMVNSSLFTMNNKNTLNTILHIAEDENTSVQLFGSNINELYNNFKILNKKYSKNLLLNMGCPQNKITKSGAGTSLANRINDIEKLISLLKKDNIDIALKIRISEFTKQYFELANKYSINYLCIHARTKDEKFSEKLHYDKIIELSKLDRNFKLVANGGILSLDDFNKIRDINVDAFMLARGVIGRPWLIQEIRENRKILLSLTEIKDLVLEHIDYIKLDKGEIKATMEINKFLENYFKDYNINLSNIITQFDYNKKIKMIKDIEI